MLRIGSRRYEEMAQHYSDPRRENDPHALPDIEVFYVSEKQALKNADDIVEPSSRGWYWWACFPGCLPDGEPTGPFETEAEALADARNGLDDES
jgi:hypothetical protein